MGNEQRHKMAGLRGATSRPPSELAGDSATTRRHARVPTECALCGAGDFSSVIEVAAGATRLLHWVSPPPGWYLLREARPEPGAPLLHGRCPDCMEQLFGMQR